MRELAAVIFDLGGVVLGSPLHAIADYERESGIRSGFVNRVVVDTAPRGAWSQLERGEISLEVFFEAFEGECHAAGQPVSARDVMSRVHAASQPRPQMLRAIARLRQLAFKVAALTNNWAREDPDKGAGALRPLFDVFIESSAVGLRKPDPRIYEHACRALEIEPRQAVFLDDIGSNLKAARALGMTTIKVEDPDEALAELAATLGVPRLEL
ncbi:MAG: HAD family phosphatase [Deltaproteobacteria bacterium]|nr:HAD family phosphatase [Deltaproteobacteria bacterium]MBW2360050.1 HAD family phosphatase [Deltaproteobacteria bacterium]